MTNEEKPKILYRGVKIDYELLKKFEFYGVDLKPPHPPIIDKQGRKTVGDGNEYGVYMTDHDIVARNAYAGVKHNDGTPINKRIIFGYDRERTIIPAVGIVYKIDTDGIDVHIPWITSCLKGHYNNSMGGNEWIAESIPESNYSIDTIEIGPDTLHDSEMIQIDDITVAKEEIIEKIEARKKRLELFEAKIEALSDKERLLLSSNKIDVLKEIYKIDGIMDVDIQNFSPTSAKDYLKYLMAVSYSEDRDNIDFATLEYLQAIKSKIKDEDLMALIDNDFATNKEKKEKFVSKKQLQGEEYSTASFDKKNAMYSKLKQQLEEKIHSKDALEQTGYSIEEDGNIYTETQQQVLTDTSGEELGNRVIIWRDNIETGTREVETIGTLENEDGKYSMKEVSRGIGTELQYQRKEMNCLNKITGQQEQYVYQKDDKGNEMYYRIADGKLTFKITKSNKGTIIDQYDKGQLTDTFEYDEKGIAIMGMEGIDSLDENYVENFFDSQVPYFEAINKGIQTNIDNQSHFGQTVDTQKLGKETIDIQKDPSKMDTVEQQINEQMRGQTQQREGKSENMQGYTRTIDEYADEVVK